MTHFKTPLDALKHHVTGAIERGEMADFLISALIRSISEGQYPLHIPI